ncbi:hypothetical protein EVAR_9550_1 [Eumeta japonica]|uniref:Uncharacterized protein n=1 Tax=Eumeta variegata TaxID=151549 RepID=A0A4C1U3W0_EUMVA|nr:hypothetical protein EVAR_9550_1 [Eumeta japonica]
MDGLRCGFVTCFACAGRQKFDAPPTPPPTIAMQISSKDAVPLLSVCRLCDTESYTKWWVCDRSRVHKVDVLAFAVPIFAYPYGSDSEKSGIHRYLVLALRSDIKAKWPVALPLYWFAESSAHAIRDRGRGVACGHSVITIKFIKMHIIRGGPYK